MEQYKQKHETMMDEYKAKCAADLEKVKSQCESDRGNLHSIASIVLFTQVIQPCTPILVLPSCISPYITRTD